MVCTTVDVVERFPVMIDRLIYVSDVVAWVCVLVYVFEFPPLMCSYELGYALVPF